jgi:hypothetical protein
MRAHRYRPARQLWPATLAGLSHEAYGVAVSEAVSLAQHTRQGKVQTLCHSAAVSRHGGRALGEARECYCLQCRGLAGRVNTEK